MAKFSLKKALQRQRAVGMEPAVMRAPFASDEFYVSWPQDSTSAELKAMKGMIVAVLDGWIGAATYWEDQKSAADLEYESWFAPQSPASGGATA